MCVKYEVFIFIFSEQHRVLKFNNGYLALINGMEMVQVTLLRRTLAPSP